LKWISCPAIDATTWNALLFTRRMAEIIAFHTDPSVETVKHDMDRDYYTSAEAAQAYGLIDASRHLGKEKRPPRRAVTRRTSPGFDAVKRARADQASIPLSVSVSVSRASRRPGKTRDRRGRRHSKCRGKVAKRTIERSDRRSAADLAIVDIEVDRLDELIELVHLLWGGLHREEHRLELTDELLTGVGGDGAVHLAGLDRGDHATRGRRDR